jgi:hypothetical protein
MHRQTLAGNLVRAVLEASDGTIWVGTHSGLSRVRENGNEIRFEHPLDACVGRAPGAGGVLDRRIAAGPAVARHRRGPDALRSRARHRCAPSACPMGCRTSNSTAAPR